jgi:hypothetical protein
MQILNTTLGVQGEKTTTKEFTANSKFNVFEN